jgi:hypothetical protein
VKRLAATSLVIALSAASTPAGGASGSGGTGIVDVVRSVTPASTAPLRDMPRIARSHALTREASPRMGPEPSEPSRGSTAPTDTRDTGRMPEPRESFDGMRFGDTGYWPPDPVGDVGPHHYVQMVNSAVSVYRKNGHRVAGPTWLHAMWSGTGTDCDGSDDGDPVVLYDEAADRWLISQFTVSGPPFYECIAISKTPDPTEAWWSYAFRTSGSAFPDYPKLGVWNDAYYMTANLYGGGGSVDVGVYAFERSAMLAGDPADMQKTIVNDYGLLPADADGPDAPPPGEPGTFVAYKNGSPDRLKMWEFEVDWATPSNTSISNTSLTVDPFDSRICANLFNCVPQPGTSQKLDSITDLVMHRLAYRNFGPYADMVVVHTVDVNGRGAIRWYQLRKPTAGVWGVHDQGTWAIGSMWRWMPSAAIDKSGNIAIGYSVSNGVAVYPGLRYAGRLASDPAGRLAQGEHALIHGSGSQTDSNRWGDYASMSVDPSDGCTFWFTGEYQSRTAPVAWRTRIGSFRFPSCGRRSLVIDDVKREEGDSGTTEFRFRVTLTKVSGSPVTVDWETMEKTAHAPSDFRGDSGTLTLSPGDTSARITIRVSGDGMDEENEVFAVKLSSASGAKIADGYGKGTIQNDD